MTEDMPVPMMLQMIKRLKFTGVALLSPYRRDHSIQPVSSSTLGPRDLTAFLLFLKGLDLISGDFQVPPFPFIAIEARLEAELTQKFLFSR